MTWRAAHGHRLPVLLGLVCLIGCKGLFGSQGPPEDPLFFDKSPLKAKAQTAPPVPLVYSEPLVPANPYFTDEQRLVGPRPSPHRPDLLSGILTNRPARAAVPEPEEDEP